jgi:hypothetical protein
MTATDTPLTVTNGEWCFYCPPGRELVCGQIFDNEFGFRVAVRFLDSTKLISLSVEGARQVVVTMREDADNKDAQALAGALDRIADQCDRLNAGWAAIGRPPDGFDSQVAGRA